MVVKLSSPAARAVVRPVMRRLLSGESVHPRHPILCRVPSRGLRSPPPAGGGGGVGGGRRGGPPPTGGGCVSLCLPYLEGRWPHFRAAGGVPEVCGSYRRCANLQHPSVACCAGATSPARQGRLLRRVEQNPRGSAPRVFCYEFLLACRRPARSASASRRSLVRSARRPVPGRR